MMPSFEIATEANIYSLSSAMFNEGSVESAISSKKSKFESSDSLLNIDELFNKLYSSTETILILLFK